MYVRGKRRGTADRASELEPGVRQVELRCIGYQSKTRAIVSKNLRLILPDVPISRP